MEPVITYEGKIAPTFAEDIWSREKPYETLTIVKDNLGNSYISKKDVPKNIPITDEEYWYPFGVSSGGQQKINLINVESTPDFSNLKVGDSVTFICSNNNSEISGGVVEIEPKLAEIIHPTEYYKGIAVGCHLGDLLIIIKVSEDKIIGKLITDDEARLFNNDIWVSGLMTPNEKNKLMFKPLGETNINNMVQTGFYYGTIGRPVGVDSDEYFNVSVKTTDLPDGNGNYSIEQTLYDRKYPKIYKRLGFTTNLNNSASIQWNEFINLSNLFVPRDGSDANNNIETGFYGYVVDNIPSSCQHWGSLSVKKSDVPDGNGYYSIEQTFYGRNENPNVVYKRLGFIDTVEQINWTDWNDKNNNNNNYVIELDTDGIPYNPTIFINACNDKSTSQILIKDYEGKTYNCLYLYCNDNKNYIIGFIGHQDDINRVAMSEIKYIKSSNRFTTERFTLFYKG